LTCVFQSPSLKIYIFLLNKKIWYTTEYLHKNLIYVQIDDNKEFVNVKNEIIEKYTLVTDNQLLKIVTEMYGDDSVTEKMIDAIHYILEKNVYDFPTVYKKEKLIISMYAQTEHAIENIANTLDDYIIGEVYSKCYRK